MRGERGQSDLKQGGLLGAFGGLIRVDWLPGCACGAGTKCLVVLGGAWRCLALLRVSAQS